MNLRRRLELDFLLTSVVWTEVRCQSSASASEKRREKSENSNWNTLEDLDLDRPSSSRSSLPGSRWWRFFLLLLLPIYQLESEKARAGARKLGLKNQTFTLKGKARTCQGLKQGSKLCRGRTDIRFGLWGRLELSSGSRKNRARSSFTLHTTTATTRWAASDQSSVLQSRSFGGGLNRITVNFEPLSHPLSMTQCQVLFRTS